jgi:branched-chain amino acid transport system ATP-binding protein
VSNLLKAERGQVTKGSITFKGERVDTMNPNDLVRRGCIQVMEGRHCFGHLNIEENLLTGAFTRKDGRAEIARDLRWSTTIFRASKSAAPAWQGTRPAASSRCVPSDAR